MRGSSRDWLWLGTAAALVALLGVVSALRSTSSVPLDSSSPDPQGALAARLWLQRLGYHVRAGALTALPTPRGTTLLILTPDSSLRATDAARTAAWVRSGGRLVVAADSDTPVGQALGFDVVPAALDDVRVVQPLLLRPPVARVAGVASAVLGPQTSAAPALATGDGPVLSERQEGKGSAWLLTAPDLLSNAFIASADNRRLWLNLAGPSGSTLVFDEGGASLPAPSQPDWLTQTPWGVTVLFLLGVLLLYRFLSGWRLGPAITPLSDRSRPAVEYVTSVAGLLRRARRRREVLEWYQQGLRRLLRERYGGEDLTMVPAEIRPRVEALLQPDPSPREDQLLQRAADIVDCEEALRRTRV